MVCVDVGVGGGGAKGGFKDMFLLPEQVAIPKILLSPSARALIGFY